MTMDSNAPLEITLEADQLFGFAAVAHVLDLSDQSREDLSRLLAKRGGSEVLPPEPATKG